MIYKKAIQRWGLDNQVLMLIEEPAELTKELVKIKRGAGNDGKIAEEIADVLIMCEQILSHYNRGYGESVAGYQAMDALSVIGHMVKLQEEAHNFLAALDEKDRNADQLLFRAGQAHLYARVFARTRSIEFLVSEKMEAKLKRLEERLEGRQ